MFLRMTSLTVILLMVSPTLFSCSSDGEGEEEQAVFLDFDLVPIDQEFPGDTAWTLLGGYCRLGSDVQFDRLPPNVPKNVQFGRFVPDGIHPIEFVAYSAGDGPNPDTLIFDMDGDKDLTNDERITFTTRAATLVNLSIPSGEQVPVKFRPFSSRALRTLPTMWHKGTVELVSVCLYSDG